MFYYYSISTILHIPILFLAQSKIISVLSNIANPDYRMSKVQACDYLGVSRATFDNYVRDGFIPKGIKQEGFKELSWQKSDLDIFLASKN